MTLEQLKEKGLSEEQAQAVLKMHKDAIDGNYVPKATFEAEREKLKTANTTIAERDNQIKELGKFQGTVDELQAKVTSLTQANAKKEEEFQAKLKDMEELTAIRAAVADSVYSVDDILPKLDRAKLTFKEGKVVGGLNDQLEAIKSSSPHYFKQSEGKNKDNSWPGGWNPFGRSPEESKDEAGKGGAVDFGKELARAFTQNGSAAQKASEIYFK